MNRAPVIVTTLAVAGAVVVHPALLHRLDTVVGRFTAAVSKATADHRPRPRHEAARTGGNGGVPAGYRALYKQAAKGAPCRVSWRVLAGIGYIESRHGANTGPSSAGALGPMQFMPATWRVYGVDGDRDGRRDVHDPADAIPAAARYLCANGADRHLRGAIWHYNHSQAYVSDVLAAADRLR